MSELYITLAHTFGPMVQIISSLAAISFTVFVFSGAAFWGERRLIRTKCRILWALPFLLFIAGLLYGVLRVSGLLRFPWDGWAPFGIWNQTHLNGGTAVLFLCGCLLIGAVLAVCRTKEHVRGGK